MGPRSSRAGARRGRADRGDEALHDLGSAPLAHVRDRFDDGHGESCTTSLTRGARNAHNSWELLLEMPLPMTDPLRPTSRPPTRRRWSANVTPASRSCCSGSRPLLRGRHELAINVWTRVLFLDRGHARARAYIERARSAVAERQREGEELRPHRCGRVRARRGGGRAATADVGRRTRRAHRRGARAAGSTRSAGSGRHPVAARPSSSWARVVRTRHARRSRGHALAGRVDRHGGGVRNYRWRRGIDGPLEPRRPVAADRLLLRRSRHADAGEPLPVPSASDVWIARARALRDKGRLQRRAGRARCDPPRRRASTSRPTRCAPIIQQTLLSAARSLPDAC